jgi:hypothetical protein
MDQRTDLLTGEKFMPLRVNQRFANPANRIKYYNQKANKLRHSISFVNRPLYINVCILNRLMSVKAEATFHKQFLLGKGFSFGVHTHYVEHDKKAQIAIYRYIIIPTEGDQIKILKNDRPDNYTTL